MQLVIERPLTLALSPEYGGEGIRRRVRGLLLREIGGVGARGGWSYSAALA
jgi:hypothetical protein